MMNDRYLPQGMHGTQPGFTFHVDISLEHRIPSRCRDVSPLLPFSLWAALKRASPTIPIGPFTGDSLISCIAVVHTPSSNISRAEAEMHAAVGGASLISSRLELLDRLSVPTAPSAITLPVITLIVMGDTWYYQIVYRSSRDSCVRYSPTSGRCVVLTVYARLCSRLGWRASVRRMWACLRCWRLWSACGCGVRMCILVSMWVF